MIYTVGLIDKYERRIDAGTAVKSGPGVKRDGRYYDGGRVWRSYEEAARYLALQGSSHGRRVYGVLADWDRDTAPVDGQSYRTLTRDAVVVRVTDPPLTGDPTR